MRYILWYNELHYRDTFTPVLWMLLWMSPSFQCLSITVVVFLSWSTGCLIVSTPLVYFFKQWLWSIFSRFLALIWLACVSSIDSYLGFTTSQAKPLAQTRSWQSELANCLNNQSYSANLDNKKLLVFDQSHVTIFQSGKQWVGSIKRCHALCSIHLDTIF